MLEENLFMQLRMMLLVFLAPLLYACSDGDDNPSTEEDQASVLAQMLSAPHTPANETLILSLLRNELGSDPFYLIRYRELRDDLEDTQVLLDEYDQVLEEKLLSVGAYLAFDNSVLQQVTNPDGLLWHEVSGIYFPSPQALLDVLQDSGYQKVLEKEHIATLRLRAFWVKPLIVRQPVDLQRDRDEFYMANLNQYRERALYPDGTDHGLTGEEADMLYTDRMLAEVLPSINAYPVLAAEYSYLLLGSDPDWTSFSLVRYPSLPEFLSMITSPLFQELVVNKNAGLARTAAMMTSPQIMPLLSE
jgi:hypothetical protein